MQSYSGHENQMKYLLISLLFGAHLSSACVIGPETLALTNNTEFTIKKTKSDICEKCSEIHIIAPKEYKGAPYNWGTYTLFNNGQLLSKTVHFHYTASGNPEFITTVRDDSLRVEITFSYGHTRCVEYEFQYWSEPNEKL